MELRHYIINKKIKNSYANLELLKNICRTQQLYRIYSGWERLNNVYDMLKMLGYTISFTSDPDDSTSIEVLHWYGYDNNYERAQAIINQLN